MMERELVGLCETAMKAADAAAKSGVLPNGPEVSRCIECLKRLKDYPVSSDDFKKTHFDRKLSVTLKKHPVQKIRQMGIWLMEVWAKRMKNGVGKGPALIRPNNSKHVTLIIKTSVATKKIVIPRSVVDQAFRRPKKLCEVKVQKTTSPSDCGDSLRNKVRETIAEALSRVSGEVSSKALEKRVKGRDPFRVSVEVENVLFKKLGPYNGSKKNRYRSIIFNIKDPNNPDFRRKILLGDVKPEKLVAMTSEEMASNQRQREIEIIRERASLKFKEAAVREFQAEPENELLYLESSW